MKKSGECKYENKKSYSQGFADYGVICGYAAFFPQDNYAYAASDELLDLEEEKSDIEDEIAEREANGESYDDLEERRNDVQDEIQNIKDEG